MSSCVDSIEAVPSPFCYLLFVLNLLLPGDSLIQCLGWGTFIMSLTHKGGINVTQLIIGIIQFVFCWTLVCWIWSVVWGVLIIRKGI